MVPLDPLDREVSALVEKRHPREVLRVADVEVVQRRRLAVDVVRALVARLEPLEDGAILVLLVARHHRLQRFQHFPRRLQELRLPGIPRLQLFQHSLNVCIHDISVFPGLRPDGFRAP